MSFWAHVDVSPGAVEGVNGAVLLGMIVARLDSQCPDARLRPFGRWSSSLWSTADRSTQGIDPVFRVSVVWPEIDG